MAAWLTVGCEIKERLVSDDSCMKTSCATHQIAKLYAKAMFVTARNASAKVGLTGGIACQFTAPSPPGALDAAMPVKIMVERMAAQIEMSWKEVGRDRMN